MCPLRPLRRWVWRLGCALLVEALAYLSPALTRHARSDCQAVTLFKTYALWRQGIPCVFSLCNGDSQVVTHLQMTTYKLLYVPVCVLQVSAPAKRLTAHEAVSTPHWGNPAAVRFSRSGARFGAVGEGGLVGLWRQDFISAVDGMGHAEWVGHCLSRSGTGLAFLGDTGSQVRCRQAVLLYGCVGGALPQQEWDQPYLFGSYCQLGACGHLVWLLYGTECAVTEVLVVGWIV
jgi:hypothetical protein